MIADFIYTSHYRLSRFVDAIVHLVPSIAVLGLFKRFLSRSLFSLLPARSGRLVGLCPSEKSRKLFRDEKHGNRGNPKGKSSVACGKRSD